MSVTYEQTVTKESIDEYKQKDLHEGGCFKLMTFAIAHLFLNVRRFNYEMRQNALKFLESKAVQAWCDCSSNFEHKKLIKYYLSLCQEVDHKTKIKKYEN